LEKSGKSFFKNRIKVKFYRYIDATYCYKIMLEVLYLFKETPCGYWISTNRNYTEENEGKWFFNAEEKKRWVSKTSRKRYAYPTKKEAQTNYLHRKIREVEILEARFLRAKRFLAKAQDGQFREI
jgi:hypothetical protein